MSLLRPCALLLVATLARAEVPEPADDSQAAIQDLVVREAGAMLEVSFRVDGAFGRDLWERIESGMPVTFSHRVELLARRAVPIIPSRVLARIVVDSTVRYDSLTRQYYLSRQTRRELREQDESSVEDTSRTTSLPTEAEAWLGSVRDLALPAPDASARERKLRLKVRTILGRRYHLLVFPATDAVDAERILSP